MHFRILGCADTICTCLRLTADTASKLSKGNSVYMMLLSRINVADSKFLSRGNCYAAVLYKKVELVSSCIYVR